MNKIACVILTVYHGTKLRELNLCVASIQKQTFDDFDVIFICDGYLNKEIKRFIERLILENINYNKIELKKNYGLAYAMNVGIMNINHKYIIRQDADTVSHKNRFRLQIEFLENNERIDLVGALMIDFLSSGEKYVQVMPLSHKSCYNTFKYRNPLNHPTVVFKNSFFKKAGLYPLKYYHDEDSALWLNGFLNKCRFSNLNQALVMNKLDKNLYKRRKEIRGIVTTLKNRIRITKILGHGLLSYLLLYIRAIIMFLPVQLLEKFYLMRNSVWRFLNYE